jgi:hypothetical protein
MKLRREVLLRISNKNTDLPPEIMDQVHTLLEPNNETEEFLLGFASCLEVFSIPLIQSELSNDTKIFMLTLLQQCAISIRDRNN